MTSATAPSLTLVTSSLGHPDARTLAGQLDGELASIYDGPTTGRDTAVPADRAPPHDLFFIGYLDDVTVACDGVRLRRDLPELRASRPRLQPWQGTPAVRELDERLAEWCRARSFLCQLQGNSGS